MPKRDLALVLVAAGRGERLGAGVPKALAVLAGEPLLAHAVRNALAVKDLTELIIRNCFLLFGTNILEVIAKHLSV